MPPRFPDGESRPTLSPQVIHKIDGFPPLRRPFTMRTLPSENVRHAFDHVSSDERIGEEEAAWNGATPHRRRS